MKSKFIFLISFLILTLLAGSCKKTLETRFAIIVDKESYEQARTEIDAYSNVLNEEGLNTVLIVKDYILPDSLKADLLSLYQSPNPIEGAVFIGDIPIAMVVDAQHMTSAFKMDQKRFGLETANVPTDRFYDDFELQFDYIKQDTSDFLKHYYSLNYDSPQIISPDIYSGRIKMPEVKNKYELLKKYLTKVVEEHRAENKLDQFFFSQAMDIIPNRW